MTNHPRRLSPALLRLMMCAMLVAIVLGCASKFQSRGARMGHPPPRANHQKHYTNETLSLTLASDDLNAAEQTRARTQRHYQNETISMSFELRTATPGRNP